MDQVERAPREMPTRRPQERQEGREAAVVAPRVRFLTCGYEVEQGHDPSNPLAGDPDAAGGRGWGFERWAVHLAVFSCQGDRSLRWWPVPSDTQAGDIFIMRLAPFVVPDDIRSELAAGREVAIGQGAAGEAAQFAIEGIGGPGLFGNEIGVETVEISDHPELSADREVAGNGIIGLALARGAVDDYVGEIPCAQVGSIVPFPDLFPVPDGTPLNGSTYGLDVSIINLDPEQWESFKQSVFAYFGDERLVDDVARIERAGSQISSGNEYPLLDGPRPRWEFGA